MNVRSPSRSASTPKPSNADSFFGIVRQRRRVPEVGRAVDHCGVGRVRVRGGDRQVDAGHGRPLDERLTDVVAVADPRDAGVEARPLANREQVGERLTRVGVVGETVDHRHRRVLGQFGHVRVVEHPAHHRVDVPREHASGVLHRLAVTELDVVRPEEQRVAPELGHPRLEGDARPRRRLLEYHRQRRPGEFGVGLPAAGPLLQVLGAGEHVRQFVARQVVDVGDVTGHSRSTTSSSIAVARSSSGNGSRWSGAWSRSESPGPYVAIGTSHAA